MFTKLFNWLASMFSRTSLIEDYSFYSLKDRQIYRYFDGIKVVSADPMILYRKLMDVKPDLVSDMKVAESDWKSENTKAQARIVTKIRGLFDVKSFEEGGLTEMETEGLLDHFLVYTDTVKKNLRSSATSSSSSVVSPPTSVESLPISSSSDSGSVASESPIAEPEPSPMV